MEIQCALVIFKSLFFPEVCRPSGQDSRDKVSAWSNTNWVTAVETRPEHNHDTPRLPSLSWLFLISFFFKQNRAVPLKHYVNVNRPLWSKVKLHPECSEVGVLKCSHHRGATVSLRWNRRWWRWWGWIVLLQFHVPMLNGDCTANSFLCQCVLMGV